MASANVAVSRGAFVARAASGGAATVSVGAAVSTTMRRVAVQPDRLVASSCADACHWYVPSPSGVSGAHVTVPPLRALMSERPSATRSEHIAPAPAALVQMRKRTSPTSPASGFRYVALNVGDAGVQSASAGSASAGVDGGVVSTVHV